MVLRWKFMVLLSRAAYFVGVTVLQDKDSGLVRYTPTGFHFAAKPSNGAHRSLP